MNYLIDTHILIWYFTGSKRLPIRAKKIIEECLNGKGMLFISIISLSEALDLAEKQRVEFDFKSMYKLLTDEKAFEIIDFTLPVFNETMKLKKVREIHDRIITATARLFGASILTKDKIILQSGETDYY